MRANIALPYKVVSSPATTTKATIESCKTELANSTILLKLILVIIVFGDLTGLHYSSASLSVPPKADLTLPSPLYCRHFAVATGQNLMLYTTIGQSILPETAFAAEIDVDTPIFM